MKGRGCILTLVTSLVLVAGAAYAKNPVTQGFRKAMFEACREVPAENAMTVAALGVFDPKTRKLESVLPVSSRDSDLAREQKRQYIACAGQIYSHRCTSELINILGIVHLRALKSYAKAPNELGVTLGFAGLIVGGMLDGVRGATYLATGGYFLGKSLSTMGKSSDAWQMLQCSRNLGKLSESTSKLAGTLSLPLTQLQLSGLLEQSVRTRSLTLEEAELIAQHMNQLSAGAPRFFGD